MGGQSDRDVETARSARRQQNLGTQSARPTDEKQQRIQGKAQTQRPIRCQRSLYKST